MSEENAQERDADFSELDEESKSDGGKASPEHPIAEKKSTDKKADDLESQIEAAKNEAASIQDKYLRALAEFENYKKRALKERSELLKYQGERILFDLLEVVDNLDLALKHAEADPSKLKTGLEMVHKLFLDILGKWEVRPESSLGKEFDPTRHTAISKVKVDDAKPGTVINEARKGYFYKDKLLRPANVVVAAEDTAQEEGVKAGEEEGDSTEEEEES